MPRAVIVQKGHGRLLRANLAPFVGMAPAISSGVSVCAAPNSPNTVVTVAFITAEGRPSPPSTGRATASIIRLKGSAFTTTTPPQKEVCQKMR